MKTFNSICLILLCVGNAFPQAQMSSGDLNGMVLDPTGAILPRG